MLPLTKTKKNRGVSMISMLFAMAITGVLIVAVMLIVDQVTRAIARNNANDLVEVAVRTIQGIVTNKDLCDNALRGAGPNAKLNFNGGPDIPVDRIYAQTSADIVAGRNTLVLRNGSNIGAGYRVEEMVFGKRPGDVGQPLTVGGVAYTTYAGQIRIRITGGGSMRDRFIPYNAVVNDAGNSIDRCYQDSSVQFMCEQLGGSWDAAAGQCTRLLNKIQTDCRVVLGPNPPSCPLGDPPATKCTKLFFISGFNPDGTPQCNCQKVCVGAPAGPATAGPAPGPGPGPAPGPGPVVGSGSGAAATGGN